jgi:hypothetical protein
VDIDLRPRDDFPVWSFYPEDRRGPAAGLPKCVARRVQRGLACGMCIVSLAPALGSEKLPIAHVAYSKVRFVRWGVGIDL